MRKMRNYKEHLHKRLQNPKDAALANLSKAKPFLIVNKHQYFYFEL